MVMTRHRHPSLTASARRAPCVRMVMTVAEQAQAYELIQAHLAWIASNGVDLQQVQPEAAGEVAGLATWHKPPRGTLLLASQNGRALGGVGVHVHPGRVAELKRLYVRPDARGSGIGEWLVRAAIFSAGDLGCDTIWLESLPGLMDTAIAL